MSSITLTRPEDPVAVKSRGARFVHRDGVDIAHYSHGDPAAQTIVCVHGWPDSHTLWDRVVPLLADRFHVVTVDNRGAGSSTNPSSYTDFKLSEMAADYLAVADAVSPDRPVHILGHDWGSVAAWELVTDASSAARIASFTSVSGPSGHHVSKWVRRRLSRPTPRNLALALGQVASLMYMFGFSTPVVPQTLMRLTMTEGRWRRGLSLAEGIDADAISLGPTFAADIRQELRVYRANFLPTVLRPQERTTDVPVQVIVGTRDPAVRQSCYEDEARWNRRTFRRVLNAGHWLPFSHPQTLARAAAELIDHVDGKAPSRELRRAEMRLHRDEFDDHLVVVSGAGSGIGRETALLFAARGAEVVASDIDLSAAKRTAKEIVESGGTAHAYQLDVSDPAQVRVHVDAVLQAHGVPDIVVNNAGVGAAGDFLATPEEEFNRVLSVNLLGVVNSSRGFAAAMVERGQGGHIVNLSSMAAYSPGKGMSAYTTSKSAVFSFSDCLRAELAEHGIGVTTVCPGIVHTNIIATTSVSGVSPEEERELQQVGDRAYALRGYGPEKVAKQIVDAVRANRSILPVTPEARIQYHVNRLAPGLVRFAASKGSMTDMIKFVPRRFRDTVGESAR
ncbi:putative peptidase S33 family protein [Gordonia araii NBRC 100433]|uniref:Putative peptidase S33 family protein n=1 Tax=Gordonia araii NBRC 100433 TaxID=1073574 RepID=G7H1C1_9ACTN|nr:SDR family oxidoreductase [Gordonia araii]NNG97594.1 SDR family oxidoreductase [Gordonia araii NBRC 100433]GAB09646.1 putative peptidase S33 family protein [Gordonia araii NBRC 100433]